MKNKLFLFIFLIISSISFAQSGKSLWNATSGNILNAEIFENKNQIKSPKLFDLDIINLKQRLLNSPKRFEVIGESNVIVSFPNSDGQLEDFRILESSNMNVELARKYPEIKSYVGQGIDNPTSTIYFSISPLGFQSMIIKADQSAIFIEPYTKDLKTYSVYRKTDKIASLNKFECKVINTISPSSLNNLTARPNADDGNLRNFRLALSVTGEYTAYFGGTKALALAAINNSMTRVNGVFEKDFGVHMNLIANNDLIIYTNASTDPYSVSTSMSKWNAELQSTLTSVIGEANYDIGHLFGATGGGGNAGCIGCVCVDGKKGSGITSPADGIPQGDNFDIDYVAHEIGHQFGGNHTFTFSNEGTIAQCEPGSGSTIMGYAGITGATDLQAHSDPLFHAVSIQQITNYVKSTTCQTTSVTGNAVPTANAGLDYTIPKGTPFVLTGSGSDANGDALTYIWEQMDKGTSTTTNPKTTATSGPAFRSFTASTNATRYFPRLSTIQAGLTSWTWEAIPNVARTLNFRLTVRDNKASGPANNSDDVIVTVNATAGPFTVSAPNTAVSFVGGSSQTVTWAVAGTTANGVNAANVDILLSTDGGNTYPIILLAGTPNDGTQAVTIPNTAGTQNRIMVKGSGHIFFDISNVNFTITAGSTDIVVPTAPVLIASGTTQTTTNLSWSGATDNIAVTGYDVYQGSALLGSTSSTTYSVIGLTASTIYSFSVKAKDAAGNISVASNTISVTTLAPVVDTTVPTAPTLTASGTTQTTTNLSWTGATDNVAVTGYDVYQGASLIASVATTSYAVSGLTASTAYTFSIRSKDAAGNISLTSNVVNVTTLDVVVSSYCTSQGNSTADEKIGKVVFGTINNTSTGTSGYENFTSLSTNATLGSAYTITITPSWTSTIYNEGYGVWIDFNGDGDFADAGETVLSRARSKTTPISGTITIPATAKQGLTRMRVSMKYNATPTSCEIFSFGQVEDYSINIVASVAKNALVTSQALTFKLYPNPVKSNTLNISSIENGTYRIINVVGQEVSKGKIEGNVIPVHMIKSGAYLLEVTSNSEIALKRFIKE
ncbi:reprolysin-like metallopeptidase [Flavobacterium luteum]|uniref:T9SS type A sorting domain-containing protein n=1 Tax=Flavobacterium luteum TaxID=2026654 RepID=A0A7J5AFA9_9FLAO|nr:zinc-dependent metalloprotease family protein [Flavobacterium luteum]KAB1156138.1 T9SS type A sorting domain-containing protein [Flavobacterium luteum]